jgi:hypothetical protein
VNLGVDEKPHSRNCEHDAASSGSSDQAGDLEVVFLDGVKRQRAINPVLPARSLT